ncbi:relaxase/mobilization nuclease domain-containing protein [Pseudomonas brassicacearum]|uniref:MobA/VirD2-like nuclease domain-containing protein n=1 Tax=Pseudomonas brassicacearum TaxID=930166 RepID=A0A423GII5_9PSED|nr:relaxase/mobilization nuclease domain-containing protein [Pseudomonas brassicacearum]ROM89385.1 hypothetical protein BK658_28135 [Pseudomonas brassicacearum]
MIARKFKNDSKCNDRVEYAFGKNHEHKCESVRFVGGNVYSTTVEDLAKEMEVPTMMRFSATAKAPGRCGGHYMLSLAPGESLTLDQWKTSLEAITRALGYTKDHKYFGVVHDDTEKQHMHIITNRTSMSDYKLVPDSKDYEALMNVARHLEVEFHLTKVSMPEETWGINYEEHDLKKFNKEVKEGKEPNLLWRDTLVARVASAAETIQNKQGGTMIDFVKILKRKEVNVELAVMLGTDNVVGINFEFRGKKISGRNLKRARFTFQKLTDQEGISYEPEMFQKIQRIVSTRTVESATKQKEKRLEKRRVGGNLPAGIGYYRQINADHYVKHGPSDFTLGKQNKKKAPPKNDEYFAICVQMQRYHYSIARRMMPPTRFNSQYMLFAFKKNYREVRTEIEVNRVIRLMQQMMSTLMTFFGIFKAQCELITDFEYSPTSDGPTYTSHIEEQPPSLTPNIRLQQLRTTFQPELNC